MVRKLSFLFLSAIFLLAFFFVEPVHLIGNIVQAHEGEEVRILIEGWFLPAEIQIEPGTTVEWRNKENSSHTVTDSGGAFNGLIPRSGKYRYTFTTPGTYAYLDQYSAYTGKITVLGQTTPPPAPAPVPGEQPAPAIINVNTGDNYFAPGSVSATVGSTITWTNVGQKPHTVTSTSGLFDSGMISSGQSFSFTFQTAGTYPYYCDFHDGQAGTITVTGGSGSPALPPITPTPKPPAPTPAPTPIPGTLNVSAGDNYFTPGSVSATVGSTITWTNVGQRPHTVTSTRGLFDSGMIGSGQSYSYTFQTAGTYPYYCDFHNGQAGTITVAGGNLPPPITTPAPTPVPLTPLPQTLAAISPSERSIIEVGDNTFNPVKMSVLSGLTVTWTNIGKRPHTVTSADKKFDSGLLKPGDSFSFTFQTAGTYPYYCIFHDGQAGAITVSDDNGASVSAPPLSTPSATSNNDIVVGVSSLAGDPGVAASISNSLPESMSTLGARVAIAWLALAGILTAAGMLKKIS